MDDNAFGDEVITVRPDEATETLQKLPYFIGISAKTAESKGLSMSFIVIPPGAVSEAHEHDGYESAIYVLEGEVETRYGDSLEKRVVNRTGDFIYIPPGLTHQAFNLSDTNVVRALVARNDANDVEKVILSESPD